MEEACTVAPLGSCSLQGYFWVFGTLLILPPNKWPVSGVLDHFIVNFPLILYCLHKYSHTNFSLDHNSQFSLLTLISHLIVHVKIVSTRINNSCNQSNWISHQHLEIKAKFKRKKGLNRSSNHNGKFHLLNEFHSTSRSTLPPESIIPIWLQSFQAGLVLKLSDKTAARPMAPLGSTATLRISQQSLIALIISVSSTVITSSTRSRTMGQVNSPRKALRPSATVFVSGKVTF